MATTSEKIDIDFDILSNEPRWSNVLPGFEVLSQTAIDLVFLSQGSKFTASNPIEISLTLTNDQEIKQLNSDHRNQNKATNVLSFPAYETTEIEGFNSNQLPLGMPIALGDIVVALETLEREDEAQNKSFNHHYQHLLIHGCLHLLGFDHENDTEAGEMESLEVELLKQLGIADPYKNG